MLKMKAFANTAVNAELQAVFAEQGKDYLVTAETLAAHAVALDAILVTNTREFARVKGLRLENWLE